MVIFDCILGIYGWWVGIIFVVVLVFGFILIFYEVLCVYVWNVVIYVFNVLFLVSCEFDKFLLINEIVVINYFNVMEEICL